MNDERTITVSGIITGVERYYGGLIFTLGKGRRKVYVSRWLLRQKSGAEILQLSDYEKFINLAGCRISATGVQETWYGGKHKSFVKAVDFSIEEADVAKLIESFSEEDREKRIEKILRAVLRKGKSDPELSKIIKELRKSESTIIVKPPAGVPFPVCFTIYKLLSGKSVLPSGALPVVLEYFVDLAYEEKGKLVLRYSEASEYASCFFLKLPEDAESAKSLIKNRLYVIDGENGDFCFTSWKIFATLRKTITYLFEVTGRGRDPAEVKRLVDRVLVEGKYGDGRNSALIRLKAIPLTVAESLLVEKGIVFVTGDAGAGKTTFLKEFAEYLVEKGKKVHKCALAGGATSVVEGETIAYTTRYGIPPAVEYVLIDEAGTIDLITFSRLIDQLRGKKVVLCGDPERQTPPPGGFEVVKNLILPFLSDHCVLFAGKAYRFDEGVEVILVPVEMKASCIRQFLKATIPFLESRKISWFMTTVIHREDAGTIKLNRLAKLILGRNPDEFEEGDRVIFKKNIKVGNRIVEGNRASAVVEKVHEDGKKLTVRGLRSGMTFVVDRSDVAPGYAFEVYNAQGKEADCVLSFIPKYFPNSDGNFERRLEVALTRAKKLTFLFISPRIIEQEGFLELFNKLTKDRFRVRMLKTPDEVKKVLFEVFVKSIKAKEEKNKIYRSI